ncbi:MAG: nucleotide exchange factor GrpE [candidate division WOR-3 bacterium]|nr:nucleotide exchange factor GrpE [candidate division WOR-3 bacterium]
MSHDKKGPVTLLKEQIEESAKSCKTFQEEYLRALADFENYRKRVERDSEQSRRLALERLIMDLLPVLDNFDRAVRAAGGERGADSVRTGMELIHRQLREALCKHGLEEYSCVGTEFDPRRAEAISFVHTDEHKPGTVVAEACKGYSCGERVLRPAKVVVAKAGQTSQKSETRDQNSEVTDQEPEEIAAADDESNENRIED